MKLPTHITAFLSLLIFFPPVAIYSGSSLDVTRLRAEHGDATAPVQLGDVYDTGAGVTRDVAEAIKWYRKAAEQGNAEGQYSLGGKYDSGDGVPQDYSQALKWYRKAAEQGHSTAEYNVGVLYYRALGVHQDFLEAARWFSKAAEQGNSDAQLMLGAFYYAGAGVPKDETEALAWFMLSAAAGNNEASKQRDVLERVLDTKKKQVAQEQSKRIAQEIEARRSASPTREKSKDSSLRYDGVYQTQTGSPGQDQFLYLRFYGDGHVVAMAAVWAPEKAAAFISRSQPQLPQGDYRLEASKVMFTTKGPRGEVDYEGVISKEDILFHIHSRVTDASGNHLFVFRPVEFPTTTEPLTEGFQ